MNTDFHRQAKPGNVGYFDTFSVILTDFYVQVVHSKFQDLVPKHVELDDPELQRPDEDRIKEVIKSQVV